MRITIQIEDDGKQGVTLETPASVSAPESTESGGYQITAAQGIMRGDTLHVQFKPALPGSSKGDYSVCNIPDIDDDDQEWLNERDSSQSWATGKTYRKLPFSGRFVKVNGTKYDVTKY